MYKRQPYGRQVPKQAHGSINLDGYTSSTRRIMRAVTELFDRIVDKNLLIRRMYVVANRVLRETDAPKKRDDAVQLDFFTDYAAEAEKQKEMCIRDRLCSMIAARRCISCNFLRIGGCSSHRA